MIPVESAVITGSGALLLIVGWISRRPWGRWWVMKGSQNSPLNELGEQVTTLVMPSLGLMVFSMGIYSATGKEEPLFTILSLTGVLGMFATIWAGLTLPVPDRFLIKNSFIRKNRVNRNRRWKRKWTTWRNRKSEKKAKT